METIEAGRRGRSRVPSARFGGMHEPMRAIVAGGDGEEKSTSSQ